MAERFQPFERIMDKITPAQSEAWHLYNEAFNTPPALRGYFKEKTDEILYADLMERKRLIYERGDKQNAQIDVFFKVKEPPLSGTR